jgi:hypothetical protein
VEDEWDEDEDEDEDVEERKGRMTKTERTRRSLITEHLPT